MLRLRRLLILAVGIVSFLAHDVATADGTDVLDTNQRQCTEKRVRKSWNAYTAQEKNLYLEAVETAMDRGYQFRFAAVHADYMNTLHSHNTCAFVLWHRRFLVAYEKMLRSLDDKFACVTLPYWNYFEDSAKELAKKTPCNNLEACSSFLRDFGGGSTTSDAVGERQVVAGIELSYGKCISKGVAGHACSNANGKASGKCEGCIMRGQWSKKDTIIDDVGPAFLSMLDVFNETVATRDAHALLSDRIESRFHNPVHNALGGTMSSMASPYDPVFYGHHTTVDMALFIFNRCRYDPTNSIDIETVARSATYDLFSSCAVGELNGVTISSDSYVHMMLNDQPVNQASDTKQFFEGVGTKYRDFVDAENLGELSYSYKIGPYDSDDDYRYSYRQGYYRQLSSQNGDINDPVHDQEEKDAAMDAAIEVASALSECGNELMSEYPTLTFTQRLEQESLLKCEAVGIKKGKIDDYTPEFRKAFHVPAKVKPYCLELIDRVAANDLQFRLSDNCKTRYGKLVGVQFP
ncbi:TPA: hypothetical protein N0F65_004965 [Lagenidium giganteum]|uniref:Tyrosinase copper-binding domain-containing protein n=1 Tax=Lagenidium giganteum TaxID=4803 RepID=A0AAV2YLR3_9STRA|nr:TPA: hypothetical protein N0F65_004965 [Lagenidium giganteum]